MQVWESAIERHLRMRCRTDAVPAARSTSTAMYAMLPYCKLPCACGTFGGSYYYGWYLK